MLQVVLKKYQINTDDAIIEPLGNGLINTTWKVICNKKQFVLQKINHHVFKKPFNIDYNLNLIANHLQQHFPNHNFNAPVKTITGETSVQLSENDYYRMFTFVPNSHTIDVVQTPEQAYTAAAMFSKFTNMLATLNSTNLKTTLPNFHNLTLRYHQFIEAINTGNKIRIVETKDLIHILQKNKNIVDEYDKILGNKNFKLRVTHHDTKISNVLFNQNDDGICVIDLDTVMPGYFISDVGDMMRTYLSPVNEDEVDTTQIEVREQFYQAIVNGYLSQMKDELSAEEKKYFYYSGTYMIYMQALRFLTDYLNSDVYYGAAYPSHNLVRARNQVVLLQQLQAKKGLLESLTRQ